MARSRPSRGFELREGHRAGLLGHALAMMVGLVGAAALNRFATPERMWFPWVALAWAAIFAAHLWRFSRGTLASMGGSARRPPPRRDAR